MGDTPKELKLDWDIDKFPEGLKKAASTDRFVMLAKYQGLNNTSEVLEAYRVAGSDMEALIKLLAGTHREFQKALKADGKAFDVFKADPESWVGKSLPKETGPGLNIDDLREKFEFHLRTAEEAREKGEFVTSAALVITRSSTDREGLAAQTMLGGSNLTSLKVLFHRLVETQMESGVNPILALEATLAFLKREVVMHLMATNMEKMSQAAHDPRALLLMLKDLGEGLDAGEPDHKPGKKCQTCEKNGNCPIQAMKGVLDEDGDRNKIPPRMVFPPDGLVN